MIKVLLKIRFVTFNEQNTNTSSTSMWNCICARFIGARRHSSTVASAVDSLLLRSLKEHYLEVSKMQPPPKINPPSPFSIVKGALDNYGPILRRTYKQEEISISVMRLANILPSDAQNDDDGGDDINQLFLHVDVSKPNKENGLHFLCGLYPDAMGIHSVSIRKKDMLSRPFMRIPSKYPGPIFQDLDEKLRDAYHSYLEERGVKEDLFPFLQAWLYVKDHRNLMRYFKTVGTFVSKKDST